MRNHLRKCLVNSFISPVKRESLKKEKVDIGANQHCGKDSWKAVNDRLKKKIKKTLQKLRV